MSVNYLFRFLNNNTSQVLILVLVFSFPFTIRVSNISLLLLGTYTIYRVIRKNGDKHFLRIHWFLLMLISFYLLSALVSHAPRSSMEKYLLLVALPIVLGLNKEFWNEHINCNLRLGFIFGNLVAAAICLVNATVRSIQINNGNLLFVPQAKASQALDFMTSSVMDGNNYFGEELSIFLHPTYFSLYLVFAQYLIFDLSKMRYIKLGYLASIYFFFIIFLFLLQSKSALICSLLMMVWIVFEYSFRKKKMLITALALLGFTVVLSGYVFFNPRLKLFIENFSFSQFINVDPNARFGHDVRILSWDASLEVLKTNWLFGVGEGRKEKCLVEIYQKKNYIVPLEQKLNSHNQYLDFMLGGGLIGIGIFLFGLARIGYQAWSTSNFALLMFISTFAFMCLFENLLSRYWGIFYFSTFLPLLSNRDDDFEFNLQFRK